MCKSIHRINEAKKILGISRSTFYLQVSKGLITKPIVIGERAVGWPSWEIDQILHARISGISTEEIRQLIIKLHNLRRKQSSTLKIYNSALDE